jgi:RimJ/RimL family protein N-acetyltransferase
VTPRSPEVPAITTARLALVALEADLLAAILGGHRDRAPFAWPDWWPDETDRHHVDLWHERATNRAGGAAWGPRAVVDAATRMMVGHAGFHLPPQPLATALADPSFHGAATPAAAGVVEIGYTIFPAEQRRGYATEAAAALIDWAFATGAVSTVLASVAEANDASQSVLRRVGGFRAIGTCRDQDGTLEIVFRRDRTVSATG